MQRIIKKISNNKFIRVSGANGLITALKALISMIANKVVAVHIGAPGVALIGQFQSMITIVTSVSGGGFNQGVTKYVSQHKEEDVMCGRFISTSFLSAMLFSGFCGIIICLFSGSISRQIFLSDSYYSVIIVFGLLLVFYNLNLLFISIINGFQLYRTYFKINLVTSIVGAILSIILVLALQEYGAILSLAVSQSVVCLITWFLIRKNHWVQYLTSRFFSKECLKLLSKYTLITLLGVIIWPVVKIFIRTYVIQHISAEEAGFWEATSKINDYIIILATGSFSVYLLPKLSEITDPGLLRKEIFGIYRVIVPFSIVGFACIFLLRNFIILLLYSPEFLKVGDYLLLQMAGSFFWMCKLIPMNFLLAKGKTNLYTGLEIVFCLMYVGLAYFLVPLYGVQGIQISFAIYNLIYLLVNLVLIKSYLDTDSLNVRKK